MLQEHCKEPHKGIKLNASAASGNARRPWISMRQQKIDKKHVLNIGPQLKLALLQAFELM
jgi:hypothetical protein